MGATDIYFAVDGKLSVSEVKKELEKRLARDRSYNGHQEGYSGDWQTIGNIEYRGDLFESFDKAYDFCSSHCEKWEGVAVKFKDADEAKIKDNKEYKKILEQLKESWEKVNDEKRKVHSRIMDTEREFKQLKSKKVTCKKCESSLSREYLKDTSCPLCRESLLSNTSIEQIKKWKEKIAEMEIKHNQLVEKREKVKLKIAEECGGTKWLLFGVAAC